MPKYSNRSKAKLQTCHPELQRLFNEIINHYDCIIIEGKRSDRRQHELFRQRKSKLDGLYRRSKHQTTIIKPLSTAVDVIPYPIDWNDKIRFYHFIGYVRAVANQLKIKIRCGADWDDDNDLNDQAFFDLPHFELKNQQ